MQICFAFSMTFINLQFNDWCQCFFLFHILFLFFMSNDYDDLSRFNLHDGCDLLAKAFQFDLS